MKLAGSESFFRRLWCSRKHILIVETGFTRPLAQVGVIADTWTHRPFQAVIGAVISLVDMTRRVMVLRIWWIRAEHVGKLRWRLSKRLISIFSSLPDRFGGGWRDL